MNSTLNILGKEIREMMTAATVLPIVVMAVLFGAMGSMMGGIEEDATGAPTVGVVNDDTHGNLAAIAVDTIGELSELAYNGADVDEGLPGALADDEWHVGRVVFGDAGDRRPPPQHAGEHPLGRPLGSAVDQTVGDYLGDFVCGATWHRSHVPQSDENRGMRGSSTRYFPSTTISR